MLMEKIKEMVVESAFSEGEVLRKMFFVVKPCCIENSIPLFFLLAVYFIILSYFV